MLLRPTVRQGLSPALLYKRRWLRPTPWVNAGSRDLHVRFPRVPVGHLLEVVADPEYGRLVKRPPDDLHSYGEPVGGEPARDRHRWQAGQAWHPGVLHDRRQHVLLFTALDHDRCRSNRRGYEGERRADEHIDRIERLHELVAEQRAITLGLKVMGGKQHLPDLEQDANVLAVVLGTAPQPVLVIRARLGRFDRQLRRDIALNVCDLHVDDLRLLTLQNRQGSANRVVHGGLEVREEVVGDDTDA